jgi:hypothetical protein
MGKPDDLEAVRSITTALAGFSQEEQERILRWVREKIGLSLSTAGGRELSSLERLRSQTPESSIIPPKSGSVQRDLKSFVSAKNPRSDVQFAATVAYYYRFDAPESERAQEINAVALQNSCRLAGRERLADPLKTLNNAKQQGLLDSGTERGKFTLNTVGENLVAMTLPEGTLAPSVAGKSKGSPKKRRR